MSIFPQDTEIVEEMYAIENIELPVFREYAIDFSTGQFLYDDAGKNIVVEKNEALKIWIWCALQTERLKYKIYNDNYGHDFESIIGKGYNKELVNAELERMIEECLLANPYINEVLKLDTKLEESKLYIKITVKTIYGEVNVDV